MKKATSFILAGMLAFSLFAENTPVASDSGTNGKTDEQEYSPGTRTATEYTSDWLGLKYTLNENMVMATDDEINNIMGIGVDMFYDDAKTGQQLLDYSKIALIYEMMVVNITDSSNIIIMAEKLMLSAITEEQYIEALKTQLDQLGPITYSDDTERIIWGVEFSEISYATEANGIAFNQMMLIKKMNDRMAIITLTYFDQTTLDALLAGFSAY